MIFHLHIEKTGGKTIEFNVERATGSRCFRTSRKLARPNIQKDYELEDRSIFRSDQYSFVTGHYHFGIHEFFDVQNPKYVSVVRDPIARLKSYYNYIMNSPMYELKQFLLDNKLSFTKFATADFHLEEAPELIKLMLFNGQTKLIAAWNGDEYSQRDLFELAKTNIQSVDYRLFTTNSSTEAYCYIMKNLGISLSRRYIKVNECPYDHVGDIPSDVQAEIQKNNTADMMLFDLAQKSMPIHADENELRRNAKYVSTLRGAELGIKKFVTPRFLNFLKAKPNSKLVLDENTKSDNNNNHIMVPNADREVPFHILDGDIKGVRYARMSNWDDTDHRLWRVAAKDADLIIDVGSNYGEFIVSLDSKLVGDANILSLEANPLVAGCQSKTISGLKFESQVSLMNCAASSKTGRADFHVNMKDTGSSSLVDRPAGAKDLSVALVKLDDLIADSGGARNLSLKIDVEGHDIEVLKGALGGVSSAETFFITLELSMKMWPEMLELLKKTPKFNSLPYYIYIWNNLFSLEEEFESLKHYKGNFDLYISNMEGVKSLLQQLSSPYHQGSVKLVG